MEHRAIHTKSHGNKAEGFLTQREASIIMILKAVIHSIFSPGGCDPTTVTLVAIYD
jgi:hypothetical protein